MDWEILIQAIGVVIAAVVSVSQLMYRLPRSRTRLKHDLELLKLLDESDPNHKIIKNHIDNSIAKTYQRTSGSRIPTIHSWSDLILGVVLLFVGIAWTLSVTRDGFSWWSLLSGFVALAGLGATMNGFEDETAKEQITESPNQQEDQVAAD